MKIEKYKTNLSVYYYLNDKTEINHGLVNNNHQHIGYWYQNEMKGFWLIDNIYLI